MATTTATWAAARPAAADDLGAHSLAGLLERNARAFPDKPAVIHPAGGPRRDGAGRDGARPAYRTLTYGRLQQAVEELAAGFTRAGITKGTKTVLMAPPGPELFALAFALFRVGAVPVVVDPGMGVRRMLHCYRTVGAEAFIGPPLAHAARLLGRRAFAGIRVPVTLGRQRLGRARTLTAVRALGARGGAAAPVAAGRDDLLMIGFTTGSTGPAKGVEYTHRMALSIARQIEAVHGRTREDTSLVTLPFYGVLDLVYGSTLVLAPLAPSRVAQADPALVVDALERFRVTTMFASPALLGPLAAHLAAAAPGRHPLPDLRCVVGGGAPVPDTTVAALRRALDPRARIHVTYGATEALPITSIEAEELLGPEGGGESGEVGGAGAGGTAARAAEGAGTCVGRPVPGIRLAVLPVTDGPLTSPAPHLPAGRVGEIAVRGDCVSPRYHHSPDADRRHKVPDANDPAGPAWHRTGDLGYLDDDGRLWFCGRSAQRVRTGHRDLHTVRCEGVFNAHPQVRRTALVGIPASTDSGWGRGGRTTTRSGTGSGGTGTARGATENSAAVGTGNTSTAAARTTATGHDPAPSGTPAGEIADKGTPHRPTGDGGSAPGSTTAGGSAGGAAAGREAEGSGTPRIRTAVSGAAGSGAAADGSAAGTSARGATAVSGCAAGGGTAPGGSAPVASAGVAPGGVPSDPRRNRLRPVVCVETVDEHLDEAAWQRLTAELRTLARTHAPTADLQEFLHHPGFPVDIRHNAKIGREELARWAERRLTPPTPLTPRQRAARIVPLAGWAYLVGGAVWAAAVGVPEARLPRLLWWADAMLSTAGHAVQIPLALPRARTAGIGRPAAVGLTMLYGATWWRQL
ncbi:AMP-binding protein [Streptomyces toxytricini]|uniref:AMP-binding protein n=1 Tax=Streptomyces toxytricini TaxID=67369 RepID=A0ABW8EGF4_STRT5